MTRRLHTMNADELQSEPSCIPQVSRHPAMGVRDLGAVVLRHAPSAITPRTIASFAGKTIAIDGNLLMTKFHHVPAPEWLVSRALPLALLERHKHVRAWYTFMRALQRQDIRPIVVFDGDARVPEKEKENIRRRAARELQRQRGQAEKTRGERLTALRSTWVSLDETKTDVLESFKETLDGVERTLELSERDEDTLQSLVTLHEEAIADADNPLYTPNQKIVTKDEETFFRNIVLEATLVVEWDEGLGKLQERSDALGVSHRKRALSVPQHAYAETMVGGRTSDELNVLTFLFQQLLDALGIPCIKPSVDEPHEAEALCSTLYSLGLVDFVVSEDTDVAVYGAPLICRFSTQQYPAKAKKNGKERTVRDVMHVLDPSTLQKELEMSPEMFVDFSLMLGTDFTERIPL